jgi:hypothetical protein
MPGIESPVTKGATKIQQQRSGRKSGPVSKILYGTAQIFMDFKYSKVVTNRHETRTADQCGQSAAREACLSELSATSAHPPVKGALAPLGRASSARDGTN